MKKNLLIMVMAIAISGLFAHNLNVIVHSNAEATGTVYVGYNFQPIDDTGWGQADFNVGETLFPFTVSDSYDLEDLQANAVGGTTWGAWVESTWQTGFFGNPPTIHLYLSFSYPKDMSVTIQTNSDAENCTVSLYNPYNSLVESQIINLDNVDYDSNGNTEVIFHDIFDEIGDYAYFNAEVSGSNVYGDSENATTTCNFIWNSNTGVWENSLNLIYSLPPEELKKYGSHWNWISYPRLYRAADNSFNAEIIVDDLEPYALRVIDEHNYFMDYLNNEWLHNILYDLKSSEGYKLLMNTPNSNYAHNVYGTKLPDQYQINLTGNMLPNWVGYWIEDTQIVSQALGNYWNDINVRTIKMQYWSAYRDTNDRWVCNGRIPTISYGDMLEIKCNSSIQGFQWDNSTPRDKEITIPETEYYSFAEQADYIPLYLILDNENQPEEIAALVNNQCIGATVVSDTLAQLNIYTENRNGGDIEFEFFYGERSSNKRISKYEYTGLDYTHIREQAISTLRLKSAYLIDLRDEGYSLPQVKTALSANNYPNPFNPTTEISFSLLESSNVNIKIYNIKGQEIITLINSELSEGSHGVIWNGLDANNNSVSSGIYFYKISTENNSLTKRMMLVK